MKTCRACKETKPYDQFFKDKAFSDGYYSRCKTCKTASTMAWRKDNKEAYNAGMRAYAKKNRRKLHYQAAYDMTVEEYQQRLIGQNNVCATCPRSPNEKKPLVVDHDHVTGKVRGLLCYNCNRLVALLDDPALLERMSEYKARNTDAA